MNHHRSAPPEKISNSAPWRAPLRDGTGCPFKLLNAAVLVSSLTLGATTAQAAGAVAIGLVNYSENFNTLAITGTSSATPNGWHFAEVGTATAVNGLYTAGTGSSNAGDVYSFGSIASADRAFGGLQSGSLTPTVGVQITNNTGATITALTVSYAGERWRVGTTGRADRLDFQFSLDASSLVSGTWTDENALDFNAPAAAVIGAVDGNAAPAAISSTISGLSIAPGATIWLRWASFDATGADDGLAIDDVSILATVGAGGNQPITVTADPASINTVPGSAASALISATDPDSIVVGATITSTAVPGITLTGFTPATADGGIASATLEVAADAATGNHVVVVSFTNNEGQSANVSVPVAVVASTARIRDIQGAAHRSPMTGMTVSNVPGVVTALRNNGFYMEDWLPDTDPATSEGIFVFTNSAPTVTKGQTVRVSGTVSEFRPGGNTTNNLSLTQISSPTIASAPAAGTLPAPVVMGRGGRVPPAQVINDDGNVDVETGGDFDVVNDGIDYYESLESMRVQIDSPVVVGPRNNFGEVWVVADGGADAGLRTARGGIVIRSDDFNPERIQIDDTLIGTNSMPTANVGDVAQTLFGIVGYDFGNFEVLVDAVPVFASEGITKEVTTLVATPDRLTVASYNVENLDPNDGAAQFNTLAAQIVDNLKSPDIIAAIEVQDNNGPTNDSTVDASATLNMLVSAIAAAGGPTYQFRQINPVDDQDGGEPGGNIRVAFLFNPARVSFVDRVGGTPTASNVVVDVAGKPQLQYSPGRLNPTNPAFNASRKPLAGEFVFKGNRLFVIANHFNSKGGDGALFGRNQPPTLTTEVQRNLQASIVGEFVQDILALDAAAKVVVLGDLNDFEFSNPLDILKAVGLTPLVETLPPEERYTYVFEGNSQVLDHIMASGGLMSAKVAPQYDVVHVNAEFADQTSDHDPEVASFLLPRPEITSSLSVQSTPFALNRRTQQFSNTVRLTNSSQAPLAGPLRVVFDGLPAGVSLANAQGLLDGKPYLEIAGLAVGAAATIAPIYNNPAKVGISYTLRVYAGPF